MNWLRANKEWVFSGVGVTTVVLLVGFLYPRAAPVPAAPAAAPASPKAPSQAVAYTNPTPEGIIKQLDSLPSFQQKGAAEAYRGLKVFWPATFSSVFEEPSAQVPRKWSAILYPDKYHSIPVVCTGVDVEANPRLKIASRDEAVDVRGTIESVSERGVWLKDATLEFR